MPRAPRADPLDIPPFLRRKDGGFDRTFRVKRGAKPGVELKEREDPDAPLHALAAELGFKRHQYQVHWLRDPAWVARARKQKEEADALRAERQAARAEQRAYERENRLPRPRKKREGGASRRKAGDLPQGRIVLLVKKNPRKEGTEPHRRFEVIMRHHGSTVESYLFNGGVPVALLNAIKQKKVRVEGGSAPAPEEKKSKRKR